MIRMVQRRLIIPRGDTGFFSIPYLKKIHTGDVAVFTIFDNTSKTKIFQKIVEAEGDYLTIALSHNDTVNLKPGKYLWDIKIYTRPQFLDGELINGNEIDSYYAGYTLPECEIKETGDNFLILEKETFNTEQLNFITSTLDTVAESIEKTETNVSHYPKIVNEHWYVWDANIKDYVDTGVSANGGGQELISVKNKLENLMSTLDSVLEKLSLVAQEITYTTSENHMNDLVSSITTARVLTNTEVVSNEQP